MSQDLNRTVPTAPKTERWVLIMALAFVPVVAALVVPDAARIALLAIGGVTFLAGFVLMVRKSRASRGDDSLRRLVPSRSE